MEQIRSHSFVDEIYRYLEKFGIDADNIISVAILLLLLRRDIRPAFIDSLLDGCLFIGESPFGFKFQAPNGKIFYFNLWKDAIHVPLWTFQGEGEEGNTNKKMSIINVTALMDLLEPRSEGTAISYRLKGKTIEETHSAQICHTLDEEEIVDIDHIQIYAYDEDFYRLTEKTLHSGYREEWLPLFQILDYFDAAEREETLTSEAVSELFLTEKKISADILQITQKLDLDVERIISDIVFFIWTLQELISETTTHAQALIFVDLILEDAIMLSPIPTTCTTFDSIFGAVQEYYESHVYFFIKNSYYNVAIRDFQRLIRLIEHYPDLHTFSEEFLFKTFKLLLRLDTKPPLSHLTKELIKQTVRVQLQSLYEVITALTFDFLRETDITNAPLTTEKSPLKKILSVLQMIPIKTDFHITKALTIGKSFEISETLIKNTIKWTESLPASEKIRFAYFFRAIFQFFLETYCFSADASSEILFQQCNTLVTFYRSQAEKNVALIGIRSDGSNFYYVTEKNAESVSIINEDLVSIDLTPLKLLSSLKRLNLSHNNLHEVDFSVLEHCTKLQILNLSYNRKIALKNFSLPPELRILNLSNCSLHESRFNPKTLKKAEKLEYLILSGNDFRVLNFKELGILKNLQYLDISGNHKSFRPKGLKKFVHANSHIRIKMSRSKELKGLENSNLPITWVVTSKITVHDLKTKKIDFLTKTSMIQRDHLCYWSIT